MRVRWLMVVLGCFMLLISACSDPATNPTDGEVVGEGDSLIATPDTFGLVDSTPQEVNTSDINVGEATVSIAGSTPSSFTATPTATDLGPAGWQINVLDRSGSGTIQLSLPKGTGTGIYEVVRSAEAMGTDGFTKVAVEMITGQGADMQMMEIEGGQLRVQANAPFTAELTFTVPTVEGTASNVTVIFNQIQLLAP
jgi:hypothetical protein